MSHLKPSTTKFKLNTGAEIPGIGLGTWRSTDDEVYNAVITALKNGYRHIDTAAIYRNEEAVGRGIRESGVPREEIFVTTKLWGTQHRNPLKGLEESLQRMGLEYVDLYLMHWPVPLKDNPKYPGIPPASVGIERNTDLENWDFVKTWELMQELPATGKTKAIGVSNFSVNNIKQLLASPGNKIVPATNQVELHPLLPQDELVSFCQEKGIVVEAYSPLGSGTADIITDPIIVGLAKKYNVEPAQYLINWGLKRGYVVLPKSITPSRIISNFQEFDLTADDVKNAYTLPFYRGEKRLISPDWGTFKTFE